MYIYNIYKNCIKYIQVQSITIFTIIYIINNTRRYLKTMHIFSLLGLRLGFGMYEVHIRKARYP